MRYKLKTYSIDNWYVFICVSYEQRNEWVLVYCEWISYVCTTDYLKRIFCCRCLTTDACLGQLPAYRWLSVAAACLQMLVCGRCLPTDACLWPLPAYSCLSVPAACLESLVFDLCILPDSFLWPLQPMTVVVVMNRLLGSRRRVLHTMQLHLIVC